MCTLRCDSSVSRATNFRNVSDYTAYRITVPCIYSGKVFVTISSKYIYIYDSCFYWNYFRYQVVVSFENQIKVATTSLYSSHTSGKFEAKVKSRRSVTDGRNMDKRHNEEGFFVFWKTEGLVVVLEPAVKCNEILNTEPIAILLML